MADWHTTKSAARFLEVSEATLRRWGDSGVLPVVRVGRRKNRRFAESDLIRFQRTQARGDMEPGAGAVRPEPHDHFATFYTGDRGRMRLSLPFIRDGLAARQPCYLVANDDLAAIYFNALAGEGVDVGAAIRSGALVTRRGVGATAREAIGAWEELFWQAVSSGAAGIRVVGEMATYEGFSAIQEMLDYEVAYDSLAKRLPVMTLCQYDVRRFDGKTTIAALQAHPDLFTRRISDFLF